MQKLIESIVWFDVRCNATQQRLQFMHKQHEQCMCKLSNNRYAMTRSVVIVAVSSGGVVVAAAAAVFESTLLLQKISNCHL